MADNDKRSYIGRGALAGGAGYAAMSPRQYKHVDRALESAHYTGEAAPLSRNAARTAFTAGRAARGATLGVVAGFGANSVRNSHKRAAKAQVTASKAFASRDQNSGGLSRMTARTPSGKYVSHENDLKVVHVSPRHAKNSSKLEHYTGGHSSRLVTHVVKGLLGPPGTGATVVSHHTVRQGSKLGVYGRSHGSKLVTHVGKAAAPFENHRLIPGNESYNSLRAGEDAWSRGPKGPKDYSGGYGRPAVRSSSAARSATVLPTKKVGGLASLARKARLR